MKNHLRKLYAMLILGWVVVATVGCGAGSPPAEEAAPPVEFQTSTPSTGDDTLSQSSVPATETVAPPATALPLPSTPIEPTATLTDSLATEITEPTPADLPTELVEPGATVSLPVSPIEEPTMTTSTIRAVPLAGSEEPLAAAVADLAANLEIDPADISLVSMEAQEWGDAGLGCPEEGMIVAPVITPGYLIILAAADQQYEYHTDLTTNVVLCREIGRAVAPAETGQAPLTPLEAAVADLAANLEIDPADISLVSMEAQEWRDASLGCPQEGMMYAQVITPGYLIILAAADQQYEYHTDLTTNVVLCEAQP